MAAPQLFLYLDLSVVVSIHFFAFEPPSIDLHLQVFVFVLQALYFSQLLNTLQPKLLNLLVLLRNQLVEVPEVSFQG
jgi:hypothetical protein